MKGKQSNYGLYPDNICDWCFFLQLSWVPLVSRTHGREAERQAGGVEQITCFGEWYFTRQVDFAPGAKPSPSWQQVPVSRSYTRCTDCYLTTGPPGLKPRGKIVMHLMSFVVGGVGINSTHGFNCVLWVCVNTVHLDVVIFMQAGIALWMNYSPRTGLIPSEVIATRLRVPSGL